MDIGIGNLSTWNQPGNFPCCHIECDNEADFIVGTSHRDYVHFCKDHINEYDNEGMEVIPNIRGVKSNG